MRIEITSANIPCGSVIEEHIVRRAHFALGRFVAQIHGVTVRLADENGPRGGEDKRCRTIVRRRRGEPIVAECLGSDLLTAIDQSLQRAGRALSRAIQRLPHRAPPPRSRWSSALPDDN